ncbi:MAG: hypothetical protein PHR35_00490, partial [Kiritimatiellae bacterium]|nr:hypothetical protein [Kiritimatiellia bacterium]
VSALALGVLVSGCWAKAASEESRYWEWGWGAYGTGAYAMSPLDVARFDWTYILFGNEPDNDVTIGRCNEILRLNPRHKFVLRTWAASGRTGFMDYFYKPGFRETLLKTIREQVEHVRGGLTKPESLVAATFQEELPDHVSAGIAKDAALYPKEIAAELGGAFDATNPVHRAWYGRKWVQFMNEINRTLKTALNGGLVIYYQGTMFSNLDEYDIWKEKGTGAYGSTNALVETHYLPFHYADIVKPGYCDGIFGYVRVAWDVRTEEMVKKLNCLMFSQVSLHPGMRSGSLAGAVGMARWEDPRNQGTFLFPTQGRKTPWPRNPLLELPYQDSETFWTRADHMRRFGWDHQIGMDIVARNMIPQVKLDYLMDAKKRGDLFRVHALVHNPRHSSWYGGSISNTIMKKVRATLDAPKGFSIVNAKKRGKSIEIGDMAAGDYRLVSWEVQADRRRPAMPKKGIFRVAVTAETMDATGLSTGEAASSLADQRIPAPVMREVGRSGDRWAETAIRNAKAPAAMEIRALHANIDFPELIRDDGARIAYKDTLRPDTLLRIGPGAKATLTVPYLDEQVKHFGSTDTNALMTVDNGYMVYAIGMAARSGDKYRIRLTGRAEGGDVMVIARFAGQRGGAPAKEELGKVLTGGFGGTIKTVESAEFIVPSFDGGAAQLNLYFYRIASKGTLQLQSFDVRQVGVPDSGIDVSDKIEGALPETTVACAVWTYRDKSDPLPNYRYKAGIRFVE